jgi:hypothetical protein
MSVEFVALRQTLPAEQALYGGQIIRRLVPSPDAALGDEAARNAGRPTVRGPKER